MNTADVIDRAADLIWLHGRCIGIGEEDGRFCVVGAIVHVLVCENGLRGDELTDTTRAVNATLGAYLSTSEVRGSPAGWNDRLPVNTDNDALVVDVMRRCSKELREADACN